jgi:hypothetical protein
MAPSAGAASGWTTPQSFGGTDSELAPRAGIAADGTSAVAWATRNRALAVSTGLPNGHFGLPRVIHRGRPRDWSVAAGPGGALLVAWGDADGLSIAVRTAKGRPIAVRRIFATTTSEIASVQVAADPRGGWVIVDFEFPKRASSTREPIVRGMSLDRSGRPLGPPQGLGPGQFGIDARQTQALAIDPEGRAVFTFTRTTTYSFGEGTVMVSTRPHGGDFGEPVAVPGPAAEPRVAVGADGRAVVAVARTDACAEAGCFGAPGVAVLGAAAAPGGPFGPPIVRPYRAFAPTAALTSGDGGVLVFQLKTKPAPFSREATVRAVGFAADGTVGPQQTLTTARANEPFAMPLSGGRVLVLWAGRRGIGAALTRPNGRFEKTSAPGGPPPGPGHTNPTNRDLRTAGRYAIFAWDGNGRARISVRRF